MEGKVCKFLLIIVNTMNTINTMNTVNLRISNIFPTLSRFNLKIARFGYFFMRAMFYFSLRAVLYSLLPEGIGQFELKPDKKLTNFNFQSPENTNFTCFLSFFIFLFCILFL